MSNKGYTVGTYIIKTEKKNSELSMCPICKKCKDRSVCQNRKNKKSMNNCDKCRKCKIAIVFSVLFNSIEQPDLFISNL